MNQKDNKKDINIESHDCHMNNINDNDTMITISRLLLLEFCNLSVNCNILGLHWEGFVLLFFL